MQDLRRIPFFIAIFLLLLIVAAETGGRLIKTPPGNIGSVCGGLSQNGLLDALGIDLDDNEDACDDADDLRTDVKGLGVPTLAFVDGVLLFMAGFMALALVVRESIIGRIQGIATFIFSLILLIAVIVVIFAALGKLLLMVGLLLSVPFGTIAYFAIYASFPRAPMLAMLSTIMLFKVGFIVLLLMAQQRFLQNRALMLLVVTSFVCNVIVSLLLGIVPGFLASITDALAAIIVGIIGAIWLLFLLIGSIPAIIKAVA
jgi:hypothetical protein